MDRVSCAQNGKDATSICIPQYKEAFFRLMSSGGMLYFGDCKWTDAEVKQLAAALQCAHAEGATSQADDLRLMNNQLTDAALPPLVEMLKAGAMPCLQTLSLGGNQLTDAALPILVEMLKAGAVPCLGEELYLDGNSEIGDEAAKEALKAAGKERGVEVYF